MFSILIPTYNNLEYLKICFNSIKKNSHYNHDIIIHVNDGSDGSLDFVKDNKIKYTFSQKNIGMPKALNLASKYAKCDYILISHDDFYFCPEWDVKMSEELKKIDSKNFYLSGAMVGAGQIKFDAGETFDKFNEDKLLKNLDNLKTFNFQGTTKCPGLIHKDIWIKVKGWSEEFSPTGGDDSDFAMKLWKNNVRIFKGLGDCLVYHFGSITTRKKPKASFTYLGSRGNKIFLNKWKIGINFFENHYLRSGLDSNKNLIFREFKGPVTNPVKNLKYYTDLIKTKIQYFYLKLINFK